VTAVNEPAYQQVLGCGLGDRHLRPIRIRPEAKEQDALGAERAAECASKPSAAA